jgi:hypothetical protein
MILGKLSLGFAAVALMAAPVLAQSTLAPAVAPLSGDEAGQSSESLIIGAVVVAGVVAAVVIASGDDEEPLSP